MSSTNPAPVSSTDRIEEEVLLRAPRARVWRALTNAEEFGAWFGVHLAGVVFAPGAHVRGGIAHPGYEPWTWDAIIEEMVPEQRFSWRWHPYGAPGADYSAEPRTLVAFTLEDTPDGGTRLRLVESGFDALPPERRDLAFRMNAGGWRAQVQERLPAHLDAAPGGR
ncbi:MAG: SRPBCC family protein [Gemmatirosa sp.]|nr:SRPBCC family protein [Gemmatirosa sp.]